ncbi:MAG: class I SAM-dependent methyltransferase [Treponema sp.]|nr:class I SAM-dependent methyltransferase [Treponema sp.]
MEGNDIQNNFPKVRPKLPQEYIEIYERMYKDNRQGKGIMSFLSQSVESWMHKIVSKYRFDNNYVLEIGAGTLNQLKYEISSHPVYDIVEPFTSLYTDSPYLHIIRNKYNDISVIPLENKYDRIISIATFEHILNLPEVLLQIKKLLSPSGIHSVAIPNEGYFLFRLGWMCTTWLAFRIKYKLPYFPIAEHEHVNQADEIENLLREHFSIIKCQVFGLSKKLCLYRVYTCKLK